MTIRLSGFKVSCQNPLETFLIYIEIFHKNLYNFASSSDKPTIIDCGAHVGISVLYFKKKFPNSRIIAFEPDPAVFKILEKNVSQNNLTGVELINSALSNHSGKMQFYRARGLFAWSWGSSGKSGKFINSHLYEKISVNSEKLSRFIDKKVDFLKIDIEGMEQEVLEEIEDKLINVNSLFIEYHYIKGNSNNHSRLIIDLLKRNRFTVRVNGGYYSNLVVEKLFRLNEPFRLNIFARKTNRL